MGGAEARHGGAKKSKRTRSHTETFGSAARRLLCVASPAPPHVVFVLQSGGANALGKRAKFPQFRPPPIFQVGTSAPTRCWFSRAVQLEHFPPASAIARSPLPFLMDDEDDTSLVSLRPLAPLPADLLAPLRPPSPPGSSPLHHHRGGEPDDHNPGDHGQFDHHHEHYAASDQDYDQPLSLGVGPASASTSLPSEGAPASLSSFLSRLEVLEQRGARKLVERDALRTANRGARATISDLESQLRLLQMQVSLG